MPPRGTIMSISPAGTEHCPDGGPVLRGDELHRFCRHAAFGKPGNQRLVDRTVGMNRFRAAAQDRRIAGAHAERGGIGR